MSYHILRNLKDIRSGGFDAEDYLWYVGMTELALGIGYATTLASYSSVGASDSNLSVYAVLLTLMLLFCGAFSASVKLKSLKRRTCAEKIRRMAFMGNVMTLVFGMLTYGTVAFLSSPFAIIPAIFYAAFGLFTYLVSGWPSVTTVLTVDKEAMNEIRTETIRVVDRGA